SMRTGKALFTDRASIARKFGFTSTAHLVITGVSVEQPLERYWERARATDFLQCLAAVHPDLVTTPNFSLFSDVPRYDNLYNMKRIAICWQELASLGIPTALHINARTDHDWERWVQFLRAHPEIHAIAFEFRTGAASPKRARWYVGRLIH